MHCLLLFLFILQGIYCYNPKRHITQASSTSSFKNLKSKSPDPVIPARYKITSTKNYQDPTITKSFPAEFFPEVEYPESIVDSSKPFYISSSPFSNDVKSTFNSLVAKCNGKASTDYCWTQNEKSKDKLPATSQKIGVNEITDTKGNEINGSEKSTNETLCEDITLLDVKDDTTVDVIPYSNNDIGKIFSNSTSKEQFAECEDKDYVVEFINDLEEIMENLTNTETPECNEDDNNAVHTFESECSNEFKLSSDMTPNNNDTIIKMNGDSLPEVEQPERIRNPLF